ncbi:YraN family protein [Synechocystis sp. CACIAM 05]|uniref:YraN family protein n=1 Tax=Synechocystis sp. CACIAM 05 TaxID=1933929 RepID=UPI00138E8981|nr:YraN family protein [Synechocystis sp. CACIAM 05]QHV00930.1 YraN family protein [Synechocystis sp. CACIAM 05]
MTDLGQAGESLVAAWLEQQGGKILQQRWRSPWGEIDLITHFPDTKIIAFVEVKTRSGGNWDQGGLLAVNARKREKIWQTANHFLASQPQWSDWNCRFDVAIVFSESQSQSSTGNNPAHSKRNLPANVELGQTIIWQGYRLRLEQYLTDAFGG